MGDSFIKAIPYAAKSPLALIGYAIAMIGFVVWGYQIHELRQVRKMLRGRKLSGDALKEIIQVTTNTVLPEKISGEQWLRAQRGRAILTIVAAIGVACLVLAGIAINLNARPHAADNKTATTSGSNSPAQTVIGSSNPK